jgi:hypothetical protein
MKRFPNPRAEHITRFVERTEGVTHGFGYFLCLVLGGTAAGLLIYHGLRVVFR